MGRRHRLLDHPVHPPEAPGSPARRCEGGGTGESRSRALTGSPRRSLSARGLARWPVILACGALAGAAAAQERPPATQPQATWELPADTRAALDEIEDFTLGFDWPGFYAVVEHVQRSPNAPGHTQTPIEASDWRELMDRPNSFRGYPVTIEGTVGRNKDPYTLPRRPQLGPVTQLELHRADQPLACTVILTREASDIPLGATIRVTGYFVMVRKYLDRGGRDRYAALLVASGPTTISHATPGPSGAGRHWWWMLGAVAVGMLVTIILMRRSAGGGRHNVHTLRSRGPAPLSLAGDLAGWADREENGAEPREADGSGARSDGERREGP